LSVIKEKGGIKMTDPDLKGISIAINGVSKRLNEIKEILATIAEKMPETKKPVNKPSEEELEKRRKEAEAYRLKKEEDWKKGKIR